jgi:hypothetical protein
MEGRKMWEKGTIGEYSFCVKYFEAGSDFGIDSGRTSKLAIRKTGTGKELCCYDRGWEEKPKGKEVRAVYKEILKRYN